MSIRAPAGMLLAAALASAAAPSRVRPPVEPSFDRRAVARIARPPLGLPAVPLPSHGPPTAAEIRLGRALFFDRRLSSNGTMSCAMCHVPEQGFAHHEMRTAIGLHGASLPRNAPGLLNVAYAGPFFLDGRQPELARQPLDVLTNPKEMGMPSVDAVVERVESLSGYGAHFASAYGGPPTGERIGRALAAYLRSLLAGDSAFDRWHYRGDPDALPPVARRGFALFVGRAGCSQCHAIGERSAVFTDHAYHDTGIGAAREEEAAGLAPVAVELAPGLLARLPRAVLRTVGEARPPDYGRFEVTGDERDRWAYKTPSLRNVALTAPYMHDGSLPDLRAVVEHYSFGGFPHRGLDANILPLGLSVGEVDDLVAFLEGLTASGIDELIRDARSQAVGNFD